MVLLVSAEVNHRECNGRRAGYNNLLTPATMASKRRARSPSDSQQRASKLAAIESPSRRAPVPVPAPTQPPVPSTSRVPLSPRNINTPARKRTSSRLNPTAATPTAQKEEDDDDDEIYVTKLRDRAQRILHERAQPREAAAAAPVNNTRVNDDINTAENTTQEHLQRVQQLQDQPARTPVRVPSPPVTRSVARRQAATTASATPQDAAATQAQDGNESKQQNKAWTLDGLYHARLFGIQPGYEHLSPAQLERRIGDIQETMHTPPTRHAQDILIDSSPSSAAKQPTLLQAGAVAAVEQKKLKPEEALFTSDAAVGNDALRTPEKQPIKQTVINHARPTAIKPAADENAAAAALSAPGSSEVGDTDSQDTPPVAAEGSDDERDEPYVVWNWCDEDEGVPQPFQEEKYGYLNWTLRRTEDLSKPKKALAAVARREGGSDADDEQLDATRPHWNQLEYVNSDDMEQGPPHPACAVDDDELALAYECLELTQAVPQLAKRYELYDRLGEGAWRLSFSRHPTDGAYTSAQAHSRRCTRPWTVTTGPTTTRVGRQWTTCLDPSHPRRCVQSGSRSSASTSRARLCASRTSSSSSVTCAGAQISRT